jgi:hypothetical protein
MTNFGPNFRSEHSLIDLTRQSFVHAANVETTLTREADKDERERARGRGAIKPLGQKEKGNHMRSKHNAPACLPHAPTSSR